LSVKPANFDYSLKVSARARHVRLAIKPYQGLEVVIPRRFPKKQIPRILQQHEEWITAQLKKHQQSLLPVALPDSIHIAFNNCVYAIEYKQASTASVLELDGQVKTFHSDGHQAVHLLRSWIRDKARKELLPKLEEIAHETGFNFKKGIVRSQKSRWGSCSSSGTISLNDQLLFLPQQTARYLMIHELCHTHHMNHSREFWKLVEKHCHDFKQHERVLTKGREKIPHWFLQDLYSV
jgi:hypothetical protein